MMAIRVVSMQFHDELYRVLTKQHLVCLQAPPQNYSIISAITEQLRRSKAEEELANITEGNSCSLMVLSNVSMERNSAQAGGAVYTTSPQGFHIFCTDSGHISHTA